MAREQASASHHEQSLPSPTHNLNHKGGNTKNKSECGQVKPQNLSLTINMIKDNARLAYRQNQISNPAPLTTLNYIH